MQEDQITEAINSLSQNGVYCPKIERVVFNIGKKTYPKIDSNGRHLRDRDGKIMMEDPVDILTTVVFFKDGTRSIVANSPHDKVIFVNGVATDESKEAGITAAICKRVLGKVDWTTGKVEGNGLGIWLHNLVENAWDQTAQEAKIKAMRAQKKAENEARQKKEAEDAHKRKIEKLAKEIANWEEAESFLEFMKSKKQVLNECKCSGGECHCNCDGGYVRPDKKFKDFTQEEKRAYWRWQKSK